MERCEKTPEMIEKVKRNEGKALLKGDQTLFKGDRTLLKGDSPLMRCEACLLGCSNDIRSCYGFLKNFDMPLLMNYILQAIIIKQ